MVPIAKFKGKLRSDSTAVRRTCDVVLPESITCPLKDLLAIHGACSERLFLVLVSQTFMGTGQ